MRYLTISSHFCKPGPPIICYSYNSFLTDTVYECKVSHTIQLEVDRETVNQTNAVKLGFFHSYNSIYYGAEKYLPIIWVTTLETTPAFFVVTTYNKTIYSGTACPNSVTYISVPLDLIVSESAPATVSERFKGIRIKAEHNRKIIVFGQNEQLGSNDAYVALPVVRLPFVMDLEYFLVSVLGRSFVSRRRDSVGLILGTADNTKLTIMPSSPMAIEHKLAFYGAFLSGAPQHLNTITIH